jgi:adenylate cyclase
LAEPRLRPRRWHRWAVQGLVLAVLATLAAGAAIAAGLGEGLQRQVTDRWFPRGRVDDRLLVVAIDQRATGVPPGSGWGFVQHAELVAALDKAGAAKIVLHNDFERLPDSDLEDSPALVRAMADADKVAVGVPPVALDPPERRRSRIPPIRARSPDLAGPYGAARGIGFTNVDPDPVDQVVRTVPLVVDAPDDDQLQPGLSLAILIETERLRPVSAAEGGGGIVVAGRRNVPTDRAGGLRVSWAAGLTPGGAGIVGALDVLQGRVPAERIRGRTVVVGLTDPAFAERHRTPVGELPGVLVHANAANTMLTGAWVRPVPVAETLAWIFCLTALVGAAAAVLPLWLVPLPAVLTAWGYLGLAGLRVDGGRLMDVVRPVSAVLAAMLGTVLVRGAAEFRKRRQVQSLFGEYVPAGVVAQLLDQDRVEAAAGGERLDVAVLFCDLRGFTTMAESLEPGQVRDVLNAYYRATTRIVFDHGGTVMQYVGDEVFAVFGAPIVQPEAAATALACALAMQRAAAGLNDGLTERGLPPVAYGIGLHRGEVVAAHVGNEIRRQYAVVGDPVNVGSRLCGQARAGEVVVSDAILDGAGEPVEAEPLGPLPLKGKRQAVRAFRVKTARPSETAGRPEG